jgi:maltokinase
MWDLREGVGLTPGQRMRSSYTPHVGDVPLSDLDARLERAGEQVLVPQRLAPTIRPTSRPVVRDQLPLAKGTLLLVVESGEEVLAAPVVPEHDTLRRAIPGDGAFAGLLDAMGTDGTMGRFRMYAFGDVPPSGEEHAIDVDQSNDSVVVGEAVVKVYPRTHPGPQPGLDVPAHLAVVGFTETPRGLGAITWRDAHDRPCLLATAAAYLPGARDGWDWFVDLVELLLDGKIAREQAEEPGAAIGSLVARLHRALAEPSQVFPAPVRAATPVEVRAWRSRADQTLREALEVGAPGLASLADRAREAIEVIDRIDDTPVMRVHGDLHVGQILRWEGGYAVSDFDGNPLAPVRVRTAADAPARDVASMARAIDHVGRVVQRRRPDRTGELLDWIAATRVRFLTAYRTELGDRSELFDDRLLFPFEVVQECHEFVYAARYLPRWSYVPERAMPALLGVP